MELDYFSFCEYLEWAAFEKPKGYPKSIWSYGKAYYLNEKSDWEVMQDIYYWNEWVIYVNNYHDCNVFVNSSMKKTFTFSDLVKNCNLYSSE